MTVLLGWGGTTCLSHVSTMREARLRTYDGASTALHLHFLCGGGTGVVETQPLPAKAYTHSMPFSLALSFTPFLSLFLSPPFSHLLSHLLSLLSLSLILSLSLFSLLSFSLSLSLSRSSLFLTVPPPATQRTGTRTGCGNFDIMLDLFSRISQHSPTTHLPCDVLSFASIHICMTLIGACNPTL